MLDVDQGRPTCHNCKRLGLECGGYREAIFINECIGPSSQRSREGSATGASSRARSNSAIPVQNELSLAKNAEQTWLKELAPPQSWTIESFTMRTIFRGERNEAGFWLPFILSQSQEGRLAGKCFAALAQVAFGRAHRFPPLEASGRRAYGKMLTALNERLRDPVDACSTDSLASVAILGVYEVGIASSPLAYPSIDKHQCLSNTVHYGWQQHQFGMANIFQLRGPQAHKSQIERQMLENLRFQIIGGALAVRKRSFLADHDWKTIPWIDEPKSSLQIMLDVYADIPGLFEWGDRLQRSSPSIARFTECEMLIETALDLLQQSQRRYDDWIIAQPDAVRPRRKDMRECALDILLLPPPPVDAAYEFEFPSLHAANHYTIHQSMIILLNEALTLAQNIEPTIFDNRNDVSVQSIRTSIDACINNIIASVPYHLAPPMDPEESGNLRGAHAPSIGALFLLSPLACARFPAQGAHRRWINTVLSHLADIKRVDTSSADSYNIGWRAAAGAPWIDAGLKFNGSGLASRYIGDAPSSSPEDWSLADYEF